MCCDNDKAGSSPVGQTWTAKPNLALAGIGAPRAMHRAAPTVAPWEGDALPVWVWIVVGFVVLAMLKA